MSPIELAANEVLQRHHPIHRMLLDYCAGCRSHRLQQLGWEDGVNDLDAEELLLLALKLRPHNRPPLFRLIREKNDAEVSACMDRHGVDAEAA